MLSCDTMYVTRPFNYSSFQSFLKIFMFTEKEKYDITKLAEDILAYVDAKGVAEIPYHDFYIFKIQQGSYDFTWKYLSLIKDKINELSPKSIKSIVPLEEKDPFGDGNIEKGVIIKVDAQKIKAAYNTLSGQINSPGRFLFFSNEDLYFQGNKLTLDPNTLNLIFIKAIYHLAPEGGKVKYVDLIKMMTKFGAEKIGDKKLVSIKTIREAVARIKHMGTFNLPNGKSIFNIIRKYGVDFSNPII